MCRGGKSMAKKRYNLMLEEKDWEYLGKIAELMGQNRAQIIRDTLTQFTGTLRNTFGDDPGKTPADLANIYRSMLVETSKALSQVAEMPDTKAK